MSAMSAYQSLLVEYEPRPIRSRRSYLKSLSQVAGLMKKGRLSSAERDIVDTLATFIEQYEALDYPTPHVPPARILAHLIASKQVTQADVSRATGIARSNLSAVVAGRREPSRANALKLAGYFGVSASVFLTEAGR